MQITNGAIAISLQVPPFWQLIVLHLEGCGVTTGSTHSGWTETVVWAVVTGTSQRSPTYWGWHPHTGCVTIIYWVVVGLY